jgi:hypothetical protein
MPTPEEINYWLTVRLTAYIWSCDPETCCESMQARVGRISPNQGSGYPWIRRERLWEGKFYSDPDAAEREQIRQELAHAANTHGIALDEDSYGEMAESKREPAPNT